MTQKSELQAQLRDIVATKVGESLDAAEQASETTEDTAAAEVAEVTETAASSEAAADVTTEEVDSGDTSAEDEAAAAAEVTADDVPLEYYGIELVGTAEERQATIDALSGRDKHIQQLLREKAEGKKVETTEPPAEANDDTAPAVVAEASDEEILEALGLNPQDEDMTDPRIQAIIGLGKFSLSLKSEVESMQQTSAVRETEVLWETSLTALEAQYGALPTGITHDEVIAEAAKNSIAEPVDAYWRIMGPARAEVLAAVKARRDTATEALKRGQGAAKPRSSAKTEPAGLKATNVKDAVKEAMLNLQKEKGLDFGRE